MTDKWQDRFIERRMMKAGELAAKFNPDNFRVHPDEQGEVTEASLDNIGWFDAVKYSQQSDMLYDGHLRVTLALEKFGPDYELPVDVYDLDETETQQALLYKDQSAAMAEIDLPKFEAVYTDFKLDIPAFDSWVADRFNGLEYASNEDWASQFEEGAPGALMYEQMTLRFLKDQMPMVKKVLGDFEGDNSTAFLGLCEWYQNSLLSQ